MCEQAFEIDDRYDANCDLESDAVQPANVLDDGITGICLYGRKDSVANTPVLLNLMHPCVRAFHELWDSLNKNDNIAMSKGARERWYVGLKSYLQTLEDPEFGPEMNLEDRTEAYLTSRCSSLAAAGMFPLIE
jgi:hypothetical protein